MGDTDVKCFVRGFLRFIQNQIRDQNFSSDVIESLEVASQCLETAYDLQADDGASSHPMAQLDPYELFCNACVNVGEDRKKEAEKVKNEGNRLMKEEKYQEALNMYNRAIALDATNPVFYCNRAAAHIRLSDYERAISDSKLSLRYDPNYSRAYGRLGIAYTKLNRNQEALEAYQNAIRLEPENQDYQNNLQCIQQRLSEAPATSAGGFNLGAAAGASGIGNPISQLLQQNMGSPNFLQSMAQLMNNDEMQNMMSRITNSENMDAFMGMAQQMAQQLSSQNPELFDNLRRQFEHTMGGPNGSNPDPSAGNKDSSKP